MEPVEQAVIAGAPDPTDAARRWTHVADAAEAAGVALPLDDENAVEIARLCCQRTPYLATLLTREPARLGRVAADPYLRREKPLTTLVEELDALTATVEEHDAEALSAVLRRFRGDEMVRLGVRELELGTPTEVGRELSRLADVCFDAAVAHHRRWLAAKYGEPQSQEGDTAPRFCVIAMGKHGGEELNFASDVDVIYIYDTDAGDAGELSLHQFFSKLAERVTASIGEVTADDVVFRVDLRLRPEGSRGAIANSLPSLERYYETWGRPWERQAWLKARPCAGDLELGEEAAKMLEPFVYRRSLSPEVIEEVRELNRRIKAELVPSLLEQGFDLKNGVGGIREVEFFVQALQLIHAGRLPALRARPTMVALDQLLFAGIITDAEASTLADAYLFLRHAEHVVQLESGRQTQRLPGDPLALEVLAGRLGYGDAAEFEKVLRGHTDAVSELFATLGEDEELPAPEILALLQEPEPAREQELLTELGFSDPAQAARNLAAGRRRADSPLGSAARGDFAKLGPALFAEISSSPDPDKALSYVVELIRRRGIWSAVWGLMAANPSVLRLVVSLFGTSDYLSRQFVGHPELIDALLLAGRAAPRVTRGDLEELLDTALANVEEDDPEAFWDTLAAFKHGQVLRIGLSDVGGELSPLEVCEELSLVAETCLQRAYLYVSDSMIARHGLPRDEDGTQVELAILALGKLGGHELGYASDLDLIFVYGADGETDGKSPLDNVTFMSRIAQRLLGGLHTLHRAGRLYEVDTRLRPSGSQGLLVSSMNAWRNYHTGMARLWERQALTKLRPVAGSRELGNRVANLAEEYVYGAAPGTDEHATRELAAAVHDMRNRIEQELEGEVRGMDVKVSRGGLIDIEFAAQFIQLSFGHLYPELRVPSTARVLERAAELDIGVPTEACLLLAQAYDFMRLLEHRMRIVHDRAVHRLPDDEDEREKLARRAGFPDGDALSQAYAHWTVEVRRTYEQILGLDRSS